MKLIDEQRLETDLAYRYEYLSEFIGFDSNDAAAIHALGPKLAERIPALVQATYDKMLAYTATARHFLPRQQGYDGPLPQTLEALSHDEGQIQFRKEHLRRYLMSLLGNPYDFRMTKYLDTVGKMHTPSGGNKRISVPLVQMNALMGLLGDILFQTIHELELEGRQERTALRAFSKLLWIQNDLINRHYAGQSLQPSPTPPAQEGDGSPSAWR